MFGGCVMPVLFSCYSLVFGVCGVFGLVFWFGCRLLVLVFVLIALGFGVLRCVLRV